jgi:metallo-beta-lactamase family protein
MQISFHGAARTVTGSKHLITTNTTRFLFDCGLFQGLGKSTKELNSRFGFDPRTIDFVLLSHAHIDHTGLLPKLVKEGFSGPIYATRPTIELSEILLMDSAEIQRIEATSNGKSNGAESQPLYTAEDVIECMKRFKPVDYNESFQPSSDIEATYFNAGHLIGSAAIQCRVQLNGSTKTVLYSGDIGRARHPFLPPAERFPPAEILIMESTYGDKHHEITSSHIDELLKWIKKTCLQKKGKLIIPAFSVGRTQEILFALNQLELEKRLPELQFFVDSPLSLKATENIKQHLNELNSKSQDLMKIDSDPFQFAGLKYVETTEDSKTLVNYSEPCVIISASGTADAGRVQHHIGSCLQGNNNTILFVGYCGLESLGGQLLDGAKQIELFRDSHEVCAEIAKISGFSAHGDTDDLANCLKEQEVEIVEKLFLVHGEYKVQQAFATRLERKGFRDIIIPSQHERYGLASV